MEMGRDTGEEGTDFPVIRKFCCASSKASSWLIRRLPALCLWFCFAFGPFTCPKTRPKAVGLPTDYLDCPKLPSDVLSCHTVAHSECLMDRHGQLLLWASSETCAAGLPSMCIVGPPYLRFPFPAANCGLEALSGKFQK